MAPRSIICDSNIWYKINSGLLSIPVGDELFSTYLSLDEMCASRKVYENFTLQSDVLKIMQNHSTLIIKNPIEYLLELDNQKSVQDYSAHYNGTLKYADEIINHQFDPTNPEMLAWLENLAITREKELEKPTEHINIILQERIDEVKTLSKEHGYNNNKHDKHNDWLASNTISLTQDDFRKIFEALTDGKNKLSNSFPWEKIELFLYTLDYFFKYSSVTEKKFEKNDWYDIFMLIYVQPNTLYWTKDKKWKKFITDSGCGHYLF
jgi:hypothetical protein